MKNIDRNLRTLQVAGLSPTLVRAPTDDDPVGVLSFAAPDRLYAVFSDERDPNYLRVTTGMGFGRTDAPDRSLLLHYANETNRAFRFVRTVVDAPSRVEFMYEAVIDDPDRLPQFLETAVPALARVADAFFDCMYLPIPSHA